MTGPETLLAGRYRLRDRVGGGGMGEVWRATDQVLGRTVAVKLMHPGLVAEPGFAERFRAEARTLATIRHGGVVTIHDYHGDDTGAFLVMEYIDGESLATLLRREGRLDPAATMAMIAEAAEALRAAHDRGVVHRDIKPANLLVGSDGSLVLTDFGIARSVDATSLTMPGAVLGTPAYIAPEQVLGHPATAASDLYSLGVVGYECLMGRRPFDGGGTFDVAMKRVHEKPLPLTGDVPAAVAAVIDRALASDPGQRWSSAADMAAAARRAIDPTGAGPTTLRRYLPGRAALPPPPTQPAPPGDPEQAPPSLPVAPAAPVYPTRVDSQLVPPAEPPEPARPWAGYHVPPSAAPGHPPAAPHHPPAAPWTGPPRPTVVTVATALFLVAAVSMLLYTVATLSVLDSVLGVVEEFSDESVAGAVGVVALVALAAVGLFGLGYLAVAAQVFRGRRGARGWAFTLAVPLLCCCLPGWCSAGLGDRVDDGQAQVFADRVTATLPGWYEALAGMWITAGTLALLTALVLVTLPPAGRYFRPPPTVVYYPYPPSP
jgi:eukaryotic-like serine/threonine-protein kinase